VRGFNAEVVRRRWPAIRRSFADFNLMRVAAWSEDETDRLMRQPGMIRNRKKIVATLRNAVELARFAARYGGVRAYLDRLQRNGRGAPSVIDRWAHYIGRPSIRCYLDCVRGQMKGDVV